MRSENIWLKFRLNIHFVGLELKGVHMSACIQSLLLTDIDAVRHTIPMYNIL